MNRRRIIVLSIVVGGVLFAAPVRSQDGRPAPPRGATAVQVAYTASVFRDVAENDARAAIKAWALAMAREIGIDAYANVDAVPNAEGLARLVESGRADLGGMTTTEFLEVEPRLDLDPIFAVNQGADPNEEYLILVQRTSTVRTLGDLRGATLKMHDNPRSALAGPWLELMLAEIHVAAPTSFFSRVEPSTKLSGVVLPVYFGQATACLVTRRGFQTMAELNPQLEKELRVIASSPPVIPVVWFFRRGFKPEFRSELVDAMANLHASPTGRQVLNLIQGDRAMILTPDQMNVTRDLMRRWRNATGRPDLETASTDRSNHLAEGSGR